MNADFFYSGFEETLFEQIEEKKSLCYDNIIAWGLSKDRLAKINE